MLVNHMVSLFLPHNLNILEDKLFPLQEIPAWYCHRSLGSLGSCGTHQLLETLSAHRLGSFKGQSERTVPDEGGENTQGTGYSKKHGVVVHFCHAVVLQQHAGMSVYVGPGVLYFAQFWQDAWHHIVQLGHQLHKENNSITMTIRYALNYVPKVKLPIMEKYLKQQVSRQKDKEPICNDFL